MEAMTERRLAAIFAADIAGFSAAMGRNEDATVAHFHALREQVDPIVTGHGGRIASTAGDSIIAEFASVAAAVDAAVEVQRVTDGGPLVLRIGINLGDIIVTEDGDVFGDGVNVAARLESEAEPGGILVSGSVRDSLRGRSPVEFEDLGLRELKNIEEPVRIHRARLNATSSTGAPVTVAPEPHADLLERSHEMETMRSAFEATASGRGSVVLVGGEAGIGKSSLVRAIAAEVGDGVLWGWCDDLMTPRTLGPFHDMASQLGTAYQAALAEDPRPERVLSALRDTLATGPARLMVIEDLHWADDATIDAVKFLARRIDQLPVLLLLTVRDAGAARVRSALVTAPPGAVTRLQLAPLSASAVATLAGDATSAERLRRLTAGNPFFLSEVLASKTDDVPDSVQDAVLARVEELSEPGRRAVELVSVAPTRLEADIIVEVLGSVDGIAEAEEARLLLTLPDGVGYRHELARRAVEASLAGAVRQRLNEVVFEALEDRNADPARLVHHASEAELPAEMVRHGIAAAEAAFTAHAFGQAFTHWDRVLSHDEHLDRPELEAALDGHSIAAFYTNYFEEALSSRQRLLRLHASADPRTRSQDHRWISRFHWLLGHPTEAAEAAAEAVAAVEHLAPTPELAFGYSNRSQLAMLSHRNEEAITWGKRAIELAESIGDEETRIHAMINVGTAFDRSDPASGQEMLEEARTAAIAGEFFEHACRAYANLNWERVLQRRYDLAEQSLREAIAYAAEHEIEAFVMYLSGTLAWLLMEVGRWDEAVDLAKRSMEGPAVASPARIPAIETLGRIAARRGLLDQAAEHAERAWTLAEPSGEIQRIGPAAGLRAELAWLTDAPDPVVAERALPGYELARERGEGRYGGELARWLHLAGQEVDSTGIEEQYRLEIEGRFAEAAAMWDELGVPFEAALATAWSGDVDGAIERLEQLGATGAVERVRSLR